ncbi:oxidoreductase [Bradyrhizobium genomosp. I (2014)]|uniref:oxidoreductase n=1 Tax=Bradyrhizobium genomosp. I (2014) TaxID=2683269 RepID=UPI0004B9AA7A|nr:FAD-dependent oxidoreductase [Bradyrhizobium sp. CCBAU 43298]
MTSGLELLFSPLKIRDVEIRNRILSTGHQTYLAKDGVPAANLVAYHEARARGGAGLIIVEAARFHPSAVSDAPDLNACDDRCIPGYAAIAEAVHKHGARIFGQLSHPGRVTRRISGGLRGVTYAPSVIPDNRFHTMPRELPLDMIAELIEGVGASARRFVAAGLDGIELVASHGLLFSQFLSEKTNVRTDQYGGSFENRLRFLAECLAQVRRYAGDGLVVGIRISAEEVEQDGLEADEVLAVCCELAARGAIDYVNTTIGSMAGPGGSIHVVPPMDVAAGYVAPKAGRLRSATELPTFVAGRINQPQIAEQILRDGLADMCGMTRALITDPELGNKAAAGTFDDIRACIGCNQACIGHFHAGYSISCIQSPLTGREASLGAAARTESAKTILVAGGGPAGMKAAVTAAERGHRVVLCERGKRLGGQALLAQLLPGRAEFGGLITNLEAEIAKLRIDVRLNTSVDRTLIERVAPDEVIIATGAKPYEPMVEGREEGHVVDAWSVISGGANLGSTVLIADWRCDWVGMGVAEKLALAGHKVHLAVNGPHAGFNLQIYLRDYWAAKLDKLGVSVIPNARIYGVDGNTAYLVHAISGDALVKEEVDTVVLATGHKPENHLEAELAGTNYRPRLVGDCLSPRTAEEAIYEGYLVGREV